MSSSTNITIAPVSGGKFINQLAAGYLLSDYNHIPEIYLGASGGIVTGTILTGAHYEKEGILRLTRLVNSNLFIKSWTSGILDFIPSSVIGFFQGSLYQHSGGHEVLIYDHISPSVLKESEVWILTCNKTKRQPTLFCSTNIENAKIKGCNTDDIISKLDFVYMDGNVKMFCDASLASSSIPALVPPKKIGREYHVDGGVLYASPIIPLRCEVEALGDVHMIYLNCSNIENLKHNNIKHHKASILDIGFDVTDMLFKNHIFQDLDTCYSILKKRALKANKKIEKISDISLEWYFSHKCDFGSSLLESYPSNDFSMELTDFDGDDTVYHLLQQKEKIKFRIWYF